MEKDLGALLDYLLLHCTLYLPRFVAYELLKITKNKEVEKKKISNLIKNL